MTKSNYTQFERATSAEIIAALKSDWGLGYKGYPANRCRCPGHGGEDANLAVKQENEKILLYCHSHNCSFEQIVRGLGLWRDPVPVKAQAQTTNKPKPNCDFSWRYTSSGGKWFESCRNETDNGKKKTWQWPPGVKLRGDEKWKPYVADASDVAKYDGETGARLPGLLKIDRPILIVEGEKSADIAKEVLAAAWNVAAQYQGRAIRDFDWHMVKNFDVTYWADHDERGIETLNQLGPVLLQNGVKSLKVITGYGNPKDDLVDCYKRNENIHEILKTAVPYVPPNISSSILIESGPASLPKAEWVPEYSPLPGISINKGVALWHGPGGASKSLWSLHASIALITNRPSICGMNINGKPIPGGGSEAVAHKVLYISLEDSRRIIDGRIGGICSLYKVDKSILDNLIIADREQCQVLGKLTEVETKIEAVNLLVQDVKPTFVIMDYLRIFYADAELVPDTAVRTIKGLESVAIENECCFILLHHDRKMPAQNGQANRGDDMASGTGALQNTCRAFAQFRQTNDGVVIEGGKANYTQRFGFQEYIIGQELVNGHAQPVLVATKKADDLEGVSSETCKAIVKAICEAEPENARFNPVQIGWAGEIAAEILELDIGGTTSKAQSKEQNNNRTRIKNILGKWESVHYLKVEKRKYMDTSRHEKEMKIYRRGKVNYG